MDSSAVFIFFAVVVCEVGYTEVTGKAERILLTTKHTEETKQEEKNMNAEIAEVLRGTQRGEGLMDLFDHETHRAT